MSGLVYEWVDGWIDGQMYRWMHAWVHRLMDGCSGVVMEIVSKYRVISDVTIPSNDRVFFPFHDPLFPLFFCLPLHDQISILTRSIDFDFNFVSKRRFLIFNRVI